MNEIKTPWLKHYGDVPFHIDYPEGSMSELVLGAAKQYPNHIALSFMGRHTTYAKMADQIDVAARAFAAMGIKEGDRVTLCMPNLPQTVICFYALNRIGAIASMIHPLSSETEIAFYLRDSKSVCVMTLDQFRPKFKKVEEHIAIPKLLLTSVADALGGVLKVGYQLTEGRRIEKVKRTPNVVMWKEFLTMGKRYSGDYIKRRRAGQEAVILYSGGTSGTTKGILLSNLNFNALALQTGTMGHCELTGKSMLAAMPMFHGFGLGVCVHTMLVAGGRAILVPRFDVKQYAELLDKEQPNYIAGVPTLYEAITRNPYMANVSLSCLLGVFSGGDSLSIELKKKLDQFLAEHGATVRVREGYGTTECVTASCLTPYHMEREGSIGLPFPDTYYKICAVGTTKEVDYGVEGEICLCGPSVMMEYINNPKETADTLKLHDDGRVWLHTGDLGYMDEDGFIYFLQRIKRMIITSGYNVYPSQVENVIDAHEAVHMSCVIGVRDAYKMQRVKAFIMLLPGYKDTPELRRSLREHCEKHIAQYAMPYDFEIRDALPKTLVGKVAYTVLEKEEAQKSA